jgi:hypothetical protein
MLLILTTKHDLTADYMIIKLRELDVPHFRLNSDELDRFGFLVQINEQHEAFKVRLGGRVVDFSDVTCVWYRRAITIASPPGVIPEYQQFAKGELRHLLEGILPRPWIRWVNPISATELGERKVHQLTVARSAGLKLPDSIIATELDELKGFIERHQGRVICKPIYQGFVAGTSNNSAVYTHRVAVSELNDAGNLQFTALPMMSEKLVSFGRSRSMRKSGPTSTTCRGSKIPAQRSPQPLTSSKLRKWNSPNGSRTSQTFSTQLSVHSVFPSLYLVALHAIASSTGFKQFRFPPTFVKR